MRIKTGFELRDGCGEKIVMAYGMENIDFSRIICLNDTAAYLWEAIGDNEFTADSMARMLCAEYEVDYERALADSEAIIAKWQQEGLVD